MRKMVSAGPGIRGSVFRSTSTPGETQGQKEVRGKKWVGRDRGRERDKGKERKMGCWGNNQGEN